MRSPGRIDQHVQTDEIRVFEVLRPTPEAGNQKGSVLQTDWDITRKPSCPEPEIIQNIVKLYANGDHEAMVLRMPFEDSYFTVDGANNFKDLRTTFISLADQIGLDLQTTIAFERSFERFISVISEPAMYFSPFWTLNNTKPLSLEQYLLCYLILADQILSLLLVKRLAEFVSCYLVLSDNHRTIKLSQDHLPSDHIKNACVQNNEEHEHELLVHKVSLFVANKSMKEQARKFFEGFAFAVNSWRNNSAKPMSSQITCSR